MLLDMRLSDCPSVAGRQPSAVAVLTVGQRCSDGGSAGGESCVEFGDDLSDLLIVDAGHCCAARRATEREADDCRLAAIAFSSLP